MPYRSHGHQRSVEVSSRGSMTALYFFRKNLAALDFPCQYVLNREPPKWFPFKTPQKGCTGRRASDRGGPLPGRPVPGLLPPGAPEVAGGPQVRSRVGVRCFSRSPKSMDLYFLGTFFLMLPFKMALPFWRKVRAKGILPRMTLLSPR